MSPCDTVLAIFRNQLVYCLYKFTSSDILQCLSVIMLHENHARTLCKNKEKTNIKDSRQAKKCVGTSIFSGERQLFQAKLGY